MKTFRKYKDNLLLKTPYLLSYGTKVAIVKGDQLVELAWEVNGRTTSPTTTKHINFAAAELGLTILKK